MAGRPPGAVNKDKPYRDALRMEHLALAAGEVIDHPKGSLRWIAQKQLFRAGEQSADAKEVADRLDGKVAQPIGGDAEMPPIRGRFVHVFVRSPWGADRAGGHADQVGGDVQAASETGEV